MIDIKNTENISSLRQSDFKTSFLRYLQHVWCLYWDPIYKQGDIYLGAQYHRFND